MDASGKKAMTARERVLAVAKGLPADQTPVMYCLNPHTTCRLMTEYRPGHGPAANLIARSMWRLFLQGEEFEASAWRRALPLLY